MQALSVLVLVNGKLSQASSLPGIVMRNVNFVCVHVRASGVMIFRVDERRGMTGV